MTEKWKKRLFTTLSKMHQEILYNFFRTPGHIGGSAYSGVQGAYPAEPHFLEVRNIITDKDLLEGLLGELENAWRKKGV
jgi:hypothetical protein